MSITDETGRIVAPPAKRDLVEEIAGPAVGTVRQPRAAAVTDLTPLRLASILQAAELGDATAYLDLAEAMEERDLHYASVLGTRKRGVRALALRVTPASEEAADEEAAALVREALDGPQIADDLIDMMDALGKGYSVTEILWDTDGPRWTIARLEHRDPRWFRFDDLSGRRLLLRGTGADAPLRPYRFIEHVARVKTGLPIRGGLARLAAWAWLFKSYSIKDWAIFAEAYGHPLRLGRYGPDASAEDRSTLLRAVRQIGVDLAAIIPQGMEVEVIEAAKSGADQLFERQARWWDEQVSKGVLGQTGTTDAMAGGYAVGRVHDEVRDDIRDSDAGQLAASLTRDLAAPLCMLNFGPRARCPRLRFEAPEDHDPRVMLAAIRALVPMGLRVPAAVAHAAFGLRAPEEGEEVLSASAAALPPGDPAARIETAAERTPAAPAIDALVERLIDESWAGPATEGMLTPVAQAVGGARSLEEVRAAIARFADEAPDEALRDLLARAMFAARLAGELGAPVEGGA